MTLNNKFFIGVFLAAISCTPWARAENSEVTRRTLTGLRGVRILVEHLQPNIQPYVQRAGITAVQLQQDIETRLNAGGIRTMSGDDWLRAAGRPVLYVNINTHETEKYWYAYDIKLELRQIVLLEVDPKIKTLADTWSINITGVANIGNLHILKKDAMVLVETFIQACNSPDRAAPGSSSPASSAVGSARGYPQR